MRDFSTKDIEIIRRDARLVQIEDGELVKGRLAPIEVDGRLLYVLDITLKLYRDLREDPKWNESQQEANKRSEKDPIFKHAVGIWDGIVIQVRDNVLNGLTSRSTDIEVDGEKITFDKVVLSGGSASIIKHFRVKEY